MLPKPEKIKKSQSAEQLDLVDSISREDKIKHKRRFVLISLILTVGLSFSFWFYKSFQHFKNNFTPPQLDWNLSIPKVNKFSSRNLDQILSNDPNIWVVQAQLVDSPEEGILYKKNATNFSYNLNISETISLFDNKSFSNDSLVRSGLPQGAKIKELINSDQNIFDSKFLIVVPQKNIIVTIYIKGEDVNNSVQKITQIMENVYWQLIENN